MTTTPSSTWRSATKGQAGDAIECSDDLVPITGERQSIAYDKDLGRGKWFIVDGDERSEVFHDKWAGTPLLLSGPKVNRVLGETIENPAQYGLEPPESVIKVTEETGLSHEFRLGNKTPDEEYNYMSVDGTTQLYTVPEVWARVVNCLVVNPPYYPPPLELGYFYEVDFRDIEELEVTHKGATVTYSPNPQERTWYATADGESTPIVQPQWWSSQLQWYAQPTKPGGPGNLRRLARGRRRRRRSPVCSDAAGNHGSHQDAREEPGVLQSAGNTLRWIRTASRYWTTPATNRCSSVTPAYPMTQSFM